MIRGSEGAAERTTFRKIMERAVPLDQTGDQRIEELLGMLRNERDRRKAKPELDRKISPS